MMLGKGGRFLWVILRGAKLEGLGNGFWGRGDIPRLWLVEAGWGLARLVLFHPRL